MSHLTPAMQARQNTRHQDGKYAEMRRDEGDLDMDTTTTTAGQVPRRVDSGWKTEWFDEQGRLHRLDGPAYTDLDGEQGWYRHGRLHRDDGPAETLYRDDGGDPLRIDSYYRRGLRHRLDGPAVTHHFESDLSGWGETEDIAWDDEDRYFVGGIEVSAEELPRMAERYRRVGEPRFVSQMLLRELRRTDPAAHELRFDAGGRTEVLDCDGRVIAVAGDPDTPPTRLSRVLQQEECAAMLDTARPEGDRIYYDPSFDEGKPLLDGHLERWQQAVRQVTHRERQGRVDSDYWDAREALGASMDELAMIAEEHHIDLPELESWRELHELQEYLLEDDDEQGYSDLMVAKGLLLDAVLPRLREITLHW